ncbi:MAG: YceD family protein [Vampirovibrionales bacterium]|nr:YceD family protein [Vampirovibrionales bacterium]
MLSSQAMPEWLERTVRQGKAIPLPDLLRLNVSRFHWSELSLSLPEPQTCEPLTGQLTLQRHPGGLLLSGALSGAVETPCRRCLKLFSQPVSLTIEEAFSLQSPSCLSNEPLVSGREVELSAADFVEPLDPEGVLDIQDVVRQLVEANLNTHAICEDCQYGDDESL